MKIGFDCGGNYIQAEIGSNVISITNDSALRQAVRTGYLWGIVAMLQHQFEERRGRKIQYTAASMGLEIVGHIIPNIVCKKININPGDAIGRTNIIDCGEEAGDDNRKYWDAGVALLGYNAPFIIMALSALV